MDKVLEKPAERVSFHTLGCRLNQAESDVLSRSFEQQGYQVVAASETADVCVLNTCTVTEHSDAKNRRAVRMLHRQNPSAKIAVVGCYAQINPEAIAKIEGVKLIIGNEEKMRVVDYLRQDGNNNENGIQPLIIRPKINKNTFTAPVFPHSAQFSTEKLQNTRAALKIQDGCDFMCSFCIIPFARGRSRCRDFLNLQEEARMLVGEGIREIVITGVNIGAYKAGKRTLVEVVDFLNTLSELSRIRISSIEPTTVPEILFQYMADPQHKLVPFFHLPLQSGADSILQNMKRRYSAGEYTEEVRRAFEAVPDLCVGTDVMVGFPGESEAIFEKTWTLLEKLPLAYFHVFPFSAREGTPAFRMEEQIMPESKHTRGEVLRSLSNKKRYTFQERFLGKTREVLWESRKADGTVSGYTDNFIRVVSDEAETSDLQNQILPARLLALRGQTMLGKITFGSSVFLR